MKRIKKRLAALLMALSMVITQSGCVSPGSRGSDSANNGSGNPTSSVVDSEGGLTITSEQALRIHVVGDDGNPMEGATIRIRSEDGEEICSFRIGKSGFIYVPLNSMASGKYFVHMLIAPEGYHLNTYTYHFFVDNSHNAYDETGEPVKDITISCEKNYTKSEGSDSVSAEVSGVISEKAEPVRRQLFKPVFPKFKKVYEESLSYEWFPRLYVFVRDSGGKPVSGAEVKVYEESSGRLIFRCSATGNDGCVKIDFDIDSIEFDKGSEGKTFVIVSSSNGQEVRRKFNIATDGEILDENRNYINNDMYMTIPTLGNNQKTGLVKSLIRKNN